MRDDLGWRREFAARLGKNTVSQDANSGARV